MIDTTMPGALGDMTEEYLALVRAFPLLHLRDDGHLDAAMAVLWPLLEQPARSRAEEEYIAALTDLVERYEDATVRIPPVSGVAMVRHLLEDRGLAQNDLVPIFGTASAVSEVLNERRGRTLTVEHIRRLALFFHVSPAVFLDDVRA